MFKLICVPAIFFLMGVTGVPVSNAEDVITIIPCSSNAIIIILNFSIHLHIMYKKDNKYDGITLMT